MPRKPRGFRRRSAMASDAVQPQEMLMLATSRKERNHPILSHGPSIRLLTNESGYAQVLFIQISAAESLEKALLLV
jgi:hypothetical protein